MNVWIVQTASRQILLDSYTVVLDVVNAKLKLAVGFCSCKEGCNRHRGNSKLFYSEEPFIMHATVTETVTETLYQFIFRCVKLLGSKAEMILV
jgi:hypothetical protein